MNGTPFERLKQIFITAIELPADERAAYLEAQPDIGHHTRRQLEDLLQADADVHSEVTRRAAAADAKQAQSQDWSGRQIGAYRIERTLGHGGMGTVFLAHRADGSLEQKVAIKVVRPDLLGTAALARFRLERQVLALLQHPNIPKMLDTGETAGGEPYVVMEYVDGEPIDRHLQRLRPGAAERLKLFLPICAAVAYAHRNLVVHRDLKPGNVIVDAEGRPQLLDFGIAKPLQRQLGAIEAVETGLSDRFISPVYASPEQLRGETITTSCDVYALGTLLYELLSGSPPFLPNGLTAAELQRRICDEDPPPPSQRAREGDERSSGLQIPHDLDLIVLRSLRKDPADRYPSVDALADDLQRYLQGLPVHARQGNAWYRLARFVVRHRAAVVAATLVITIAVAGGALFWKQQRATHTERLRADNMTTLITNALASLDPASRTAREMTAREMFERIAAQTETDPNLDPTSRSQVLGTVAGILFKLGQLQSAEKVLAQVEPSRLDTDARHAMSDLRARALMAQSRFDDARRLIGDDMAAAANDDARRSAVLLLAASLDYRQGQNKEAWEKLATVRTDTLPATDVDQWQSLRAVVLWELNRYDEAVAEATSLIDRQRERLGPDSPAVFESLRMRGTLESRRGNNAEAIRLGADLLRLAEKLYGRNSTHYARALNFAGNAALDEGDLAKAIDYEEQALVITNEQYGANSDEAARKHINLASLYEDTEKIDKAHEHYRLAHDIAQRVWLPDDTNLLLFRTAFVTFLALQEKSTEIEPVVQAARRDIAANPQLEARDLVALMEAAYALDAYRRDRTPERQRALAEALRTADGVCQDDPEVKKAYVKVLTKAQGLGVAPAS
jgi:serine/threonine protein kinase